MSSHYHELKLVLARARSRWRRAAILRVMGLAAAAASLLLGLAILSYAIARPTDIPLIVLASVAVLSACGCFAYAAWRVGRAPSDRQVARFVEERVPELEDRVATAVEFGEQPAGARRPVVDELVADASSRIRGIDLGRVVGREAIARAALIAASGVGLLLVAAAAGRTPAARAFDAAAFYAFPSRIHLDVRPGDATVAAGASLRVRVRVRGATEAVTPILNLVAGLKRTGALPMAPSGERDEFAFTVEDIKESLIYRVSAGAVESAAFTIRVLRPPHVKRIDLSYEYPPAFGLKNRVEEDSGDMYAPVGTTVRMRVLADKPVASGELVMTDKVRLPLRQVGSELLEASLKIEKDGSYRVALGDLDGLRNPGETEYFIRTLDDRPPDVRIIRPTGDQEVTALQEVTIEARADDDHGIAQLDLVYSVRGSRERVVPLHSGPAGLTARGSHTLYLEDLAVQPGDFVTYFARARDIDRGKKSTEVRSDIFFLEVKPYEEEFVAAESQGGFATSDRSLEELAQAQKDIIVATWKLDRRALDGRSGQSRQDVLQVARAQGEVQERTREIAAGMRVGGGRSGARGSQLSAANPVLDALTRATVAMGRAKEELQGLKTTSATPFEMEALNGILKALAETRRRQVSRSQQANAAGGSNRAQRDLSTLFDRELRRQQETNYEKPVASDRKDAAQSEAADRVRELARRQAALGEEERELADKKAQMSEEEQKRRLERLTREQSALRQQAEELSRALSQSSESGQTSRSKDMRAASDDMRHGAAELRRNDPAQASQSSQRALDRLKKLETEMRAGAAAGADTESKKLADQLAQAQRGREQMKEVQRRIDELMQQIQQLRAEQGTKPNGGRGADAKEGPRGDLDKLARLQEELQAALKQAQEIMARLGRAEGGGFGVTPEGQQLSRSASGLESYKQDFSKWDSLKKDINLALEQFEISVARKLIGEESRSRLNAGADDRAPQQYRQLVDKYYRSLAKK